MRLCYPRETLLAYPNDSTVELLDDFTDQELLAGIRAGLVDHQFQEWRSRLLSGANVDPSTGIDYRKQLQALLGLGRSQEAFLLLTARPTTSSCGWSELDNDVTPVGWLTQGRRTCEHFWHEDKLQVCGGIVEAAQEGKLAVLRWLLEVRGLDAHSFEDVAFRRACRAGHLNVAQYLHSLGGVDVHADGDYAVRWACLCGSLEMAKWLHSVGADVHADEEWAFRFAAHSGRLDVCQWLHAECGVDAHVMNDQALRMACASGHLAVAQWLVEDVGSCCSLSGVVSRQPHVAQWLLAMSDH